MLASACAITVLTVVVGLAAGGGFVAYPRIDLDTGPAFVSLTIGVVALALLPWAGRSIAMLRTEPSRRSMIGRHVRRSKVNPCKSTTGAPAPSSS